MRQRSFPPAHGGGNLCGKPAPRSRTPTPRPRLKYVRSVWANRPLPLLVALLVNGYADGCPGVSPTAVSPERGLCKGTAERPAGERLSRLRQKRAELAGGQ